MLYHLKYSYLSGITFKIYNMTKNEEKEAKKFMKEHENCSFTSSIGGKFSYIITPTGLGECVSIRCNACEAIKDITDIESW